jgi:ATP/maltotriose-dependent transcriptional regulator MalT
MRAMALRVSSPILVGRAAELEALLAALDRAAGGRPTTVLVSGEAGIGKTRLVHELSEHARASGAIVLRGVSVRLGSEDGLPFAPVVEALRGVLRSRGPAAIRGLLDASTAELATLLPELGDTTGELAPEEQRPDWAMTRLFESLLVLLRRLGEDGPAVFVVEDLHWADRSTRDLFAFLVRAMTDERVLLVGTYRSDELHRRHPLLAWIGELDRAGVERIGLGALDPDSVRAQVEAIVGERPDAATLEAISVRSGGNPFFAEELIAAGAVGRAIPSSLRDLLLARVWSLSPEAQELLGVASVAGLRVDHDVLCDVIGRDEASLSAVLRETVAQHLLVPSADGAESLYAFRHALQQEAVYDDLLPRDRRRLHARFAEVLLTRPVSPGAAGASQLAAIAHHAEAAHDLPLALAAWFRAARAALAAHAVGESTLAYARCLELWDAVPADDRPPDLELTDVLYQASFSLAGIGEVHRARAMVERAVELVDPDQTERLARLLVRLGRTEWLSGDLVAATHAVERAMALVEDAPTSVVSTRVLAAMSGLLMLRGQTRRAVELGRRALRQAEELDEPRAITFALNTLGAALADSGRCEEGIATGRRGLALALELDRADEMHRAYANLATALQLCGRLDEAERVALEGGQWARRRGMWRLQGAFLDGTAADVLVERGRWDEARALLQFDERELQGVARLHVAMTAGQLAVRTGRHDEAHRRLDEQRPALARIRDTQFTGPIYRGLAELAIAEGRLADVQVLVDEALELMSETDGIRHRAALLALAVQAAAAEAAGRRRRREAHDGGLLQAVDRRLEQLRRLLAGRPDAPANEVAHAEASLAGAEAERLVAMGSPAADAWSDAARRWTALNQAYPAAWCRACEAEARLSAGEREAGEGALRAAHAAAIAMGAGPLERRIARLAALARVRLGDDAAPGAGDAPAAHERDPARVRSGDTGPTAAAARGPRPFDLTDRERQILPLLAAGYTNRQIADALFVSESTAGVHVSRIIGKMGVANRVEAAALAVRSGLADEP